VHNTIDNNNVSALAGGGAVVVGGGARGTDLRNDILSNNTGFGIVGADASFAFLDDDDFAANTQGPCSSCALTGTHSLDTDPLYVDSAAADYRLRSLSPLIDAGLDLGYDVNGPAAGNFNGKAPDIGAWESP
jgi:hypothetical protein